MLESIAAPQPGQKISPSLPNALARRGHILPRRLQKTVVLEPILHGLLDGEGLGRQRPGSVLTTGMSRR
jgi:hypothetical protein